jgi:Na+-translocating ferredoxin:NAD+ oxidoreductase RnfG subunit
MQRRRTLLRGAALGGLATLWNPAVFAVVYIDIEQARKLLLPQAVSFAAMQLTMDAQLSAAVSAATGKRVPAGFQPMAWAALDAQGQRIGFVLADRVTGKYELIDYAVGFSADGAVTQVEVLAYRESHGGEVRSTAWRKQFAGRKGPGEIRFGDDIKNISGATLSCEHVTDGIQRLSALVAMKVQKKS